MANVIKFGRKHHDTIDDHETDARHRRPGYFDESDVWHDADTNPPRAENQSG